VRDCLIIGLVKTHQLHHDELALRQHYVSTSETSLWLTLYTTSSLVDLSEPEEMMIPAKNQLDMQIHNVWRAASFLPWTLHRLARGATWRH